MGSWVRPACHERECCQRGQSAKHRATSACAGILAPSGTADQKFLSASKKRLGQLAALFDIAWRVAFPLPWRYGVAQNGFKQRPKRQLAVIAVGEQNHA